MSNEDLAELRGLREPPETLGTLLADGIVSLALGLLVAWLLVQAVKLFWARETSPEELARRRLAGLKEVEGPEGLAARAEVLLDLGQALPEGDGNVLDRVDEHLDGFLTTGAGTKLREALYRPQGSFDLTQFDRELDHSLRRAEG